MDEIVEAFGLDLTDPETKAMWEYCGDIIQRYQEIQKIMVETWKNMQPALERLIMVIEPYIDTRRVKIPANAKKTRYGYSIETRSYRRPKKRSSRGIKVQQKRKRLGLNTWGKYSEGAYAGLSRKEAYARAMQTERVLVLCQVCDTWFMKRVRIVLVDYWYKPDEAITCTRCGTQHEAGIKLWWKWIDAI